MIFSNKSFAQTSISGVINTYVAPTAVTNTGTATTCNSVEAYTDFTVASSTGFAVGDTVMVIQMQGATAVTTNGATFGSVSAYGNAGNYEITTVVGITTTNIRTLRTVNAYAVGSGLQLVNIPAYKNVSVAAAGISAQAWNGNTGGVLALYVTGTLTMNGNINATGLGFRGGADVDMNNNTCATSEATYFYNSTTATGANKGEGIAAWDLTYYRGRGAWTNGGGGGNLRNAGGGGGSNVTAGGAGGDQRSNCGTPNISQGIGGYALTGSSTRIFMGGGGGAGFGNSTGNKAGGAGGGIIFIKASTLVRSAGSITANGAAAVNLTTTDEGAGGGGGGGTILMDVTSYTNNLTVTATGGNGGNGGLNGGNSNGPGGGGSGGQIRSAAALPGAVTASVTAGSNGLVSGATRNATAGTTGSLQTNLTISKTTCDLAPALDLGTLITISAGPYKVGQTITFTVGAVNNTTVDALKAQVAIALPAGVTYVSAAADLGSYSNVTGIWTLGTMPAGDIGLTVPGRYSLTITATINSTSALYSTATISHAGNDPNSTNDFSALQISPDADLAITQNVTTGPYKATQTIKYSFTATNNGLLDATNVLVTDVLPSGITYTSAVASQGSYASGTGIWSVGSLANGASATLTLTVYITALTSSVTNTATITGDQKDRNYFNNTAHVTISPIACTTAGLGTVGTGITGIVNTYYPGTSTTVAAGSTTLSVGTSRGAATGIAPGDLILIMQMQDASINSTNSASYGDGDADFIASGVTSIVKSGTYEYVKAVSLSGNTLTFTGTGTNGGCVNSYSTLAYSAAGTTGQKRFQVIRVPVYSSASIGAALTSAYWDGTSGGVLAVEVEGALNLNGATVSVNGRGFRGGGGNANVLAANSANTTLNSDYVNLSSGGSNAAKGEGIAGTPQWVFNEETATSVNYGDGVNGYPNGSDGRGAPGNGGGGGSSPDENTQSQENAGGGGGGNGGVGGRGGYAWRSKLDLGGFGGSPVLTGINRLIMGGGGGAGDRNNGSNSTSSGAAGGGIIMIRARTMTGTGTWTANGATPATIQNDGSGGGGAGGTVVAFALTGGLTGLTIQAKGATGGSNNFPYAAGYSDDHGPGGGGGGGIVYYSSAPASVSVAGGTYGLNITTGNIYGATSGATGYQALVTRFQPPGIQSGADCNDVVISGTVYNDANGASDNIINGTATNTIGTNTIYANLINNTTSVVIASVLVNGDGTYRFGGADGVTTSTTFKVTISNTQGTVGAAGPAQTLTGAVNTSEGTVAAGDGTPNGSVTVTVAATSVTTVNFGIDRIPTATAPAALATQVNPGSTKFVALATGNFVGTDPEDVTAPKIKFTNFPTGGVNSINFGGTVTNGVVTGGTTYTSGTFPAAGITVTAGTTVAIDPTDVAVTVSIPFKAVDNANQESTSSVSLTVPFSDLTISGTVYNDANGITDNLINGTATNTIGTNTLYANLLNAAGTSVLATVAVAANGTYSFGTANGIQTNTSYNVTITNTIGTVGSAGPSRTLTGALNTAEGTTGTGDGTPDGLNAVAVVGASIGFVNFGIDRIPTATAPTALATQVNPGGTSFVALATGNFVGTDPEDVTAPQIKFTTFPTGGVTSINFGGTVTNGVVTGGTTYTSGTFPATGVTVAAGTTVAIDPAAGAVTAAIPFKAVDNAGKESSNTASLSVPFRLLTVSGTVYNDVNGLTDNLVNGTGIGTVSGNQLYAYLSTGGLIVDKVSVGSNGAYAFTSANVNTAYSLQISTNSVAIGTAPPSSLNLPSGWAITGDAYGIQNDGTPNGEISGTTTTADFIGVNFGIEQVPTATAYSFASQVNPGGASVVSLGTTNFTGTDPDGGSVAYLKFTTYPTNVTSIIIAGTTYTGSYPVGGVTVAAASAISIDPSDGAVTASIPFKVIDNAGQESLTAATVSVPFSDLTISGTVYNDANGITDNLINGTATNTIGTNTLYANLLNAAGTSVLATVAVAANGTYSFGTANGIQTNTSYNVTITNTIGTVGSAGPSRTLTGALNTAEGTTGTGDGTPDGLNAVAVVGASIGFVNFGIDRIPTATNPTALAAQPDPGSTNFVAIPAASLAGTDPEDGMAPKLKFLYFPTNVTSINFGGTLTNGAVTGGTTYNSTNFPADGLIVTAGTAVFIDPAAPGTSQISFKAIDNANKESSNTAVLSVPFTDFTITASIVCGTSGTTTVTVTNPVTGYSYQLYKDNVAQGSLTVYSSGTLSFSANITASTVFYVKATFGTTVANSSTVTVAPTVVTTPAITTTVVCGSSGNTTITVINPVAGHAYQLFKDGIAQGTSTAYSSGALTYTSAVSTSTQFYVVATLNTCTANSGTSTVSPTIVTTPTITTSEVCGAGNNTTITVTNPVAGYAYQLFKGGVAQGSAAVYSSGALTYTQAVSASTQFYVQATFNTCTSNSATVTVTPTVVTTPTITTSVVCGSSGNTTVTVTNAVSGQSYQLYKDGIAQGTSSAYSSGTLSYTSVVSASTQFYVQATLNTCTANSNTATVAPTVVTTPNITTLVVCGSSGNTTITVTNPVAGHSYQLFKDGIGVGSPAAYNSGALTYTSAVSASTQFYVVATLNTCSATSSTATVAPTVVTTPTITTTIVCGGSGNTTITVTNPVAGHSYQLFKDNVAQGTSTAYSSGTLSYNSSVTASTQFFVRATLNTCIANSTTATVAPTVVTTPTITTTVVCGSSGNTTITVTNPMAGYNYQLYKAGVAQGVATTYASGTLSYTSAVSGSTDFYVLATYNTCTAASATTTVTPTVVTTPVITTTVVCGSGNNTTITVTNPVAGYAYQLFKGGVAQGIAATYTSGTLSYISSVSSSTDFYVQATYNTCFTNSLTATVLPTVVITPTLTTTAVCGSSGNTTITVTNPQSGYSYQLFRGGVAQGSPAAYSSGVLSYTEAISGSTSFYVVATFNTCPATSSTVVVAPTVVTSPTITTTLVCGDGNNTTITVTNPVSGHSYQLFKGGVAQGTAAVYSSGTLAYTLAVSGSTSFYVQASLNTCTANSSASIVTPTVVTTPAITTSLVCGNGNNTTITVTSPVSGHSYQLFKGGVAQGSAVAYSGGALSFTSAVSGSTDFYVQASLNTCTANSNTVTVTPVVLTTPVLSATVVCGSSGNSTITVTNPVNSYTYQLYKDNIAQGSSAVYSSGVLAYSVAITGGTDIYVQATASSCSVSSATTTVTPTVLITPEINSSPVCSSGSSTTITVSNPQAGYLYQLFRNGVAQGTAAAYTGAYTAANITGSTTFYVVATNSGCTVTSENVVVTITGTPLANLAVTPSETIICNGNAITAVVEFSENGVLYQLYNLTTNTYSSSAITGTGSNITLTSAVLTTSGTNNFKVIASRVGCSSVDLTDTFSISVTALPVTSLTVSPASQAVCSGSVAYVTIANSQNGVFYQLYDNNISSGNAVAGTGGTITLTSAALSANTVLTIKALDGPCEVSLTGTSSVTIDCIYVVYDPKMPESYKNGDILAKPRLGFTATNYRLASGTLLPGTALNPTTGEIYVLDINLLEANGTTVFIEATDSNGNKTIMPVYYKMLATPLPVKLVSFTATAGLGKVNLNWATATEVNNLYFEIERSSNGAKTFVKIGQVKGAGNSQEFLAYSYTDLHLANGIYYYRLKQVDADGAVQYSKIVTVTITGNNAEPQLDVFPNPAGRSVNLTLSISNKETYVLEIKTLAGVLISTEKMQFGPEQNQHSVNLEKLASGTYLFILKSDKKQFVSRLVKQ